MKLFKNARFVKAMIVAQSVLLCLVLAVGGTVAWLTDMTEPVKNTFTVGDINITLTESENLDLKMVPGKEISKDPCVTIKGNSEPCYVFVKVEASENYKDFIAGYSVDDVAWIELTSAATDDGLTKVYYLEFGTNPTDQFFPVLKDADTENDIANPNGSVKVLDTVTKAALNALTADTYPPLTFTAYAVQKDNVATAAAAWALANPTT